MSGLKLLLMTNCCDDISFIEYFPINYSKKNIITELLIITKNFNQCNRGSLQHKNSIYYYTTFIPEKLRNRAYTNISNYSIASNATNRNSEKIFLLFYCDKSYKKLHIDAFILEIFEILDHGAIQANTLKEDQKFKINELFKKYQSFSKMITEINSISNSFDNEESKDKETISTSSKTRNNTIMSTQIECKYFPLLDDKKTVGQIVVDQNDLTVVNNNDTDLSLLFKGNTLGPQLPKFKQWKKIQKTNIILCIILVVLIIISLIVVLKI